MLERDPPPDKRDSRSAGRRRAAERPVRARRQRPPLRDRGQPARLAHGAVRLEGDRGAARKGGLPADPGRAARRPGAADARSAPSHVSVKEAVLPFQRFHGSDSLLGPGDEVDGRGDGNSGATSRPPSAKSQAAAGVALPHEGSVFISVCDTDKPAATQLAARMHDLGFRVLATRGTAQAIRRMGVPVEKLNKIGEGSPHVVDRIRAGDVDLLDQHAGRPRRAHRRLGDPARGRRARHPLHNHDDRRIGRRRRDRRWRAARPQVHSLQELHGRRPSRARRSRSASAAAKSGEGVTAGAASPRRSRWASPRPSPDRGRRRRSGAGVPGQRKRGRRRLPAASAVEDPTAPRRCRDSSTCWLRPTAGVGERATSARISHAPSRSAGRAARGSSSCVESIGPGTDRLARLAPGERRAGSSARSGSGSPSRRRSGDGGRPARCWSAGGIGIAPLVIWAEALDAARSAPESSWRAFARRAQREPARAAWPATWRSRPTTARSGHHGLVTELLERELEHDRTARSYTRAARRRCSRRSGESAHEHAVPAQLAMEEAMACGFGACFGCVVQNHDRLPATLRRRPGHRRRRPRRDLARADDRASRDPATSTWRSTLAVTRARASDPERFRHLRRDRGAADLRGRAAPALSVRRLRLQDDHARAPRAETLRRACGRPRPA